ncbi:GTD2A protein, partial [Polyodon spathula]|nr:GTD2A protein [Polyodon spathula]
LLDVAAMHLTTTANNTFQQLEKCARKMQWEKLIGLTDRVPPMCGEKNWLWCAKNYRRAKCLNHWQFQKLLAELNAQYGDLPHQTEVHWLSHGAVPARFFEFHQEILICDITEQLNNLKVQGCKQVITEMYDGVKALQLKFHVWGKTQAARFQIFASSSTYFCEHLFSLLKIYKSAQRSLLNDKHLHSVLKIFSAQNMNPDIDKLDL